ncbi:hypothetical protein B0H13DRAFT_2339568 [Mycena leptocephala]|nr:hypothetical protein B0H13DRAFT_2339568 [Mycena leptocephala]
MLCSHRIPCSRVPTPPFRVSTLRYTITLPSAERATRFPPRDARPLAFPLCTRPRTLTVSRTPARCPHAHARSPFPDSPHAHARSSFPTCPFAASRLLLRLALPPPPRASSSASRFPSASRLPSASPHLHLALLRLAPLCLARLCLAGEAEPGAERDKNWL